MVVHNVSPQRRAELQAEYEAEAARQRKQLEEAVEFFRKIGREDVAQELLYPKPSLIDRVIRFVTLSLWAAFGVSVIVWVIVLCFSLNN